MFRVISASHAVGRIVGPVFSRRGLKVLGIGEFGFFVTNSASLMVFVN